MNHGRFIPILLLSLLFLQPLAAFAQTTPTPAQIRQRFNPNVTLQGGNTFSGISFSGVGGAIAGCMNVGGSVAGLLSKGTSSLAGLFKSKPGGGISPDAASDTTAPPPVSGGNPDASSGIGAGATSVSSTVKNALGISATQSVPVEDAAANKELAKANQRENCLNGVAYAIAKSLLQQITNRTLNWVNTGFGGNPLYVRDMDSFLATIRDEHIERFLRDIPNQNPIFGNAIRSIVTQKITGVADGYIDSLMDTPEARAYQSFQEDFTNGGWESFLNPNNSAIDALFNASDDLALRIETDQQNVLNQLMQSGGFLDMRACIEFEDTSELDRFIESCNTGDISCGVRAYQDALDRVTSPECLRYETVTPGSVIAAQVNAVSTSHIRQLEQADQINEVLGSFFDQLLNKLFSFGLRSTGGRTSNQWGFGGIGDNVVLGSNGQPLDSLGADALGYQSVNDTYALTDFDISRPQQLRAILQTQYDYLSHALDAHIALNRILPTLGALDYCVPGPNPTWRDGLNENAGAYFSSLQEVQKGTSRFGQILQTIPLIGGLFGSNESHTIASVGTQLYDKASGQMLPIADTAFHENNRSTATIFENVQRRYGEVLDYYEENYTEENIRNAFMSVDPSNAAYVSGFLDETFDELMKLPGYSQALLQSELDGGYSALEAETREAIEELQYIKNEVDQLVSVAKARYISERAAEGNPVDMACIDMAYDIDTSPIIPAPRGESDVPSPFLLPSVDASAHFYQQL